MRFLAALAVLAVAVPLARFIVKNKKLRVCDSKGALEGGGYSDAEIEKLTPEQADCAFRSIMKLNLF